MRTPSSERLSLSFRPSFPVPLSPKSLLNCSLKRPSQMVSSARLLLNRSSETPFFLFKKRLFGKIRTQKVFSLFREQCFARGFRHCSRQEQRRKTDEACDWVQAYKAKTFGNSILPVRAA